MAVKPKQRRAEVELIELIMEFETEGRGATFGEINKLDASNALFRLIRKGVLAVSGERVWFTREPEQILTFYPELNYQPLQTVWVNTEGVNMTNGTVKLLLKAFALDGQVERAGSWLYARVMRPALVYNLAVAEVGAERVLQNPLEPPATPD